MKKAILSVGILIWGLLAVIVSTVLVYAMFDLPKPAWVENLPGTIWKGENRVIQFGGSTTLLLEEDYVLDGIENLQIIAAYHSVTVTLHDGVDMRVRHYDYDAAEPLTADFSGGSLTVTTQKWNVFTIFGFYVNPRLEIEIPRTYAGNVDISTVSGSVKAEGGVAWGGVRLKTTSGSVHTGDMDAGSIDIHTTSGSLNLGTLAAGGNVKLKTVSGSIHAGDVKGYGVTSETTSGGHTFGAIDADGMIRLTAVSGGIRADAVRSPEHYIKTTSGSIRIGELTGTGEVRSTSGSVRTGEK